MRKSRAVSTLLLAGSAVALFGCGDSEPQSQVKIYTSVDACAAERPRSECDEAFKTAQSQHLATAPRFTSASECEKEFGAGACQTVTSSTSSGESGSSFVPFMMGYMVANALDDLGDASHRSYGYSSRPLYVDRYGNGFSGDRAVTRFSGGCRQDDRNCGNSGSAIISGSTGGRGAVTTSVASSVTRSAPKPATVSSISSGRASFGSFGSTGGRAGGFGGG